VGFLVLVLVALTLAVPSSVAAKSAEYTRFDVAVELRSDGTFHVTETQQVRFSDGPFSLGHREVPLARTEEIVNVTVSELDEAGEPQLLSETDLSGLAEAPDTFNVRTTSTEVRVLWTFESLVSGTKTFVVEYDVLGALRYYPDEDPANQQVWWTAIGQELTKETPVRASTVTVTLPRQVPLDQVVLGEQGKDVPSEHSSDGRVFTWTRDDLGRGDEFTVRLQFPPIVQGVAPPTWQAADDAQRAKDTKGESRQAVVHLIMMGLGLALVAGGGTSIYGLWYLRGRDPHAGVVADFIPKPPDDLPPGVVGALLDEHADECDVVATLVDLGRRGVIKITDVGLLGPTKRESGHDYVFELVDADARLSGFERPLVRAIFGSSPKAGVTARLGDMRGRVIGAFPLVKQGLYDELVARGLFPRSPESTRDGWRKTGLVVLVVAVLAGLIAIAIEGWWAVFPVVAAVGLGGLLFRLGRSMPRKTAAGAEAAARWRAFRRYLEDIEGYERVSESRQIFDQYLPYTVAFGIDTAWVRKFAAVETETPGWFESVGDVFVGSSGRPSGGYDGWTVGAGPRTGGGGVDLPDVDLPKLPSLQKASNRASSGLQSGSSGFSDLLNVAGAIFSILDAFSGGGGSGGSSGGGGGGFS
jgi:hypothetical protein